jgi:D-lactate dehydrogenase
VQRLANNFGAFTSMVPPLLNMVDFAHRLVGPKPLEFLSKTLNKGTGHIVPEWNPYLPKVRASSALFPLHCLALNRKVSYCCYLRPIGVEV